MARVAYCFQESCPIIRGSQRRPSSESQALRRQQMRGQKGDQKFQGHRTDGSDVQVVCYVHRLSLEELTQLHVSEIDGIKCQHHQVWMTHLLQQTWRMARALRW